MILCTVLYCDVHTASDASSSKMLETQDLPRAANQLARADDVLFIFLDVLDFLLVLSVAASSIFRTLPIVPASTLSKVTCILLRTYRHSRGRGSRTITLNTCDIVMQQLRDEQFSQCAARPPVKVLGADMQFRLSCSGVVLAAKLCGLSHASLQRVR